MSKPCARTTKKLAAIVTLGAAMAATFVATRAYAAGGVGPVSQVEYNADGGSNPRLMIQINGAGTNYFVQQSSPCSGVPSQSIETIKMFLSIAQASLLSGKKVTLYTNSCGSTQYIYDIVMAK
jgi:hypothetical protein